MNEQAVKAKHAGMIIVGGGLIKHHICNANLMVCRINNHLQTSAKYKLFNNSPIQVLTVVGTQSKLN